MISPTGDSSSNYVPRIYPLGCTTITRVHFCSWQLSWSLLRCLVEGPWSVLCRPSSEVHGRTIRRYTVGQDLLIGWNQQIATFLKLARIAKKEWFPIISGLPSSWLRRRFFSTLHVMRSNLKYSKGCCENSVVVGAKEATLLFMRVYRIPSRVTMISYLYPSSLEAFVVETSV